MDFNFLTNMYTPLSASCPTNTRYPGETLHLSVVITGGTPGYSVQFYKKNYQDTAYVAVGSPITVSASGGSASIDYTITGTDYNGGVTTDSELRIMSKVTDSCPGTPVIQYPECITKVNACPSPTVALSVT